MARSSRQRTVESEPGLDMTGVDGGDRRSERSERWGKVGAKTLPGTMGEREISSIGISRERKGLVGEGQEAGRTEWAG